MGLPCSSSGSDSDEDDAPRPTAPGGLPRAGGSSGSETEMELC